MGTGLPGQSGEAKLNFSFDSIHNALISDKFQRRRVGEAKNEARHANQSLNVGRKGVRTEDNSVSLEPPRMLVGDLETVVVQSPQVEGVGETEERPVAHIPAKDLRIPGIVDTRHKESKIFDFKKVSDEDIEGREQRELETLKQQMKTQYRVFNRNSGQRQGTMGTQGEIQRGRFAQYRTKPEHSSRPRFSPVRTFGNGFQPRSLSTAGGRESMALESEGLEWTRRFTRKMDFGQPLPANLNASPGMSATKLQNSGSTLKRPKHSQSRGYNNFINVSVPSQYIILQGHAGLSGMKRSTSMKPGQFAQSFTADHYVNLTQIHRSNLRNKSARDSEHGSRSPHPNYSQRVSQMGGRGTQGSFGSGTMSGVGNSFAPMYSNYVQSSLPLGSFPAGEGSFGQRHSTLSWVPSTIPELLLLLCKKVLVYNSKIDSLQKKIFENNPGFSVKVIFKEVDQERKAFLTPHDMGYFLHYFGFRVSDWEIFKLMGYLSSYKVSTLSELISSEGSGGGASGAVQSKYFGQNGKLSSLSLAKQRNTRVFIDYESFSRLFRPLDRKFRRDFQRQSKGGGELTRGVKKNEFYLIRQIILLSFRKLDEIGMILQYLRKHRCEDVFELLCSFNEGMYQRPSDASQRFDSESGPEQRSLTRRSPERKEAPQRGRSDG